MTKGRDFRHGALSLPQGVVVVVDLVDLMELVMVSQDMIAECHSCSCLFAIEC